MSPARIVAAMAATAGGLVLLAHASAAPWPYHTSGQARLRLSWSARPERIEVCRRLKGEPACAGIPVIHMSASYYQEEDRQRGLESGAIAYITGFDVQTVVKTVRDVLRRD